MSRRKPSPGGLEQGRIEKLICSVSLLTSGSHRARLGLPEIEPTANLD